MRKKAFIFDMDGLLLDSERLSFNAWQIVCKDNGFNLTQEIFTEVVGRTVKESAIILEEIFGKDFDYYKLRIEKMKLQSEQVSKAGIPIKPGANQLIDRLIENQIRRVVATSTIRAEAEKKLALSGLLDKFEFIVCGDEVKNGKPAPDIFIKAHQQLGLPAEQVLVLEDSPFGAIAANKAGLEVIIIPDLKQPDTEVKNFAKAVLPNLTVLSQELDRYC